MKYHTKALLKRKVPYFLNYIRVVGMRKRGGGKTYLEFLPPKLLPPGSTPPPISEKELVGSRILHRAKPRSTVFHHDGAWSYDRVIKDKFKKLRSRSVVHANMEFVRPIRSVRLPGGRSSSLSGTQAIDSTWKTLDRSIPSELKTKANHDVNPRLVEYVWSWLYRVNSRNVDGFEKLGGHFKA